MNFTQLMYFLKLAEAGSFSRAANNLFITQQGLSHSTRSLEDELDVKLINRGIRGIQLTNYGKLLHQYAETLTGDYNRFLHELSNMVDDAGNELRLGLPFGIFSSIPFELLITFRKNHPGIIMRDAYYRDNEFEERFLEDKGDIAIANVNAHMGRREDPQRFEYIKLYRNLTCVTVNKKHPLARKKQVEIGDLSGMDVAVYDENFYNDSRLLHADCAENGITDIRFHYYSEQSSLMRFAEQNYGAAIMVLSLNDVEKSPFTVDIPFADKDKYGYEVSIFYPLGDRVNNAMKMFIRHTRQFIRSVPVRPQESVVAAKELHEDRWPLIY